MESITPGVTECAKLIKNLLSTSNYNTSVTQSMQIKLSEKAIKWDTFLIFYLPKDFIFSKFQSITVTNCWHIKDVIKKRDAERKIRITDQLLQFKYFSYLAVVTKLHSSYFCQWMHWKKTVHQISVRFSDTTSFRKNQVLQITHLPSYWECKTFAVKICLSIRRNIFCNIFCSKTP